MPVSIQEKIFFGEIKTLRYFYLIGSIFYAFSIIAFERFTQVSVFNIRQGIAVNSLINASLIAFPLSFYFGLPKLTLRVFYMICGYHIFFMVNSAIVILNSLFLDFDVKPIIQIVEKSDLHLPPTPVTSEYHVIAIHIFSIIIGLIIIAYLQRKKYFFHK